MKITQLQCDINKKKYNFIDIVNNSCSCMNLKGWLTGFFLGLIVFMGCSLACVHAWFF